MLISCHKENALYSSDELRIKRNLELISLSLSEIIPDIIHSPYKSTQSDSLAHFIYKKAAKSLDFNYHIRISELLQKADELEIDLAGEMNTIINELEPGLTTEEILQDNQLNGERFVYHISLPYLHIAADKQPDVFGRIEVSDTDIESLKNKPLKYGHSLVEDFYNEDTPIYFTDGSTTTPGEIRIDYITPHQILPFIVLGPMMPIKPTGYTPAPGFDDYVGDMVMINTEGCLSGMPTCEICNNFHIDPVNNYACGSGLSGTCSSWMQYEMYLFTHGFWAYPQGYISSSPDGTQSTIEQLGLCYQSTINEPFLLDYTLLASSPHFAYYNAELQSNPKKLYLLEYTESIAYKDGNQNYHYGSAMPLCATYNNDGFSSLNLKDHPNGKFRFNTINEPTFEYDHQIAFGGIYRLTKPIEGMDPLYFSVPWNADYWYSDGPDQNIFYIYGYLQDHVCADIESNPHKAEQGMGTMGSNFYNSNFLFPHSNKNVVSDNYNEMYAFWVTPKVYLGINVNGHLYHKNYFNVSIPADLGAELAGLQSYSDIINGTPVFEFSYHLSPSELSAYSIVNCFEYYVYVDAIFEDGTLKKGYQKITLNPADFPNGINSLDFTTFFTGKMQSYEMVLYKTQY